ncbi:MAG: ribosome-binding factor A [Kiritimatiellae bacterium]|jgi:ribosome-binding factor A|nr:ribosome-binding factor A [Kiritimatiellia bacterium]
MAVKRVDRINSLLRRAIGEALYHVFAGESIDLAAITITEVDCAPNLRTARVMVSIFGHDDVRTRMLSQISRKGKELQTIINRDLTLKYTPRLQFKLDLSVEKGDHVLDILTRMDDKNPVSDDNPDV